MPRSKKTVKNTKPVPNVVFPKRVWAMTANGRWASHPITLEDKRRRQCVRRAQLGRIDEITAMAVRERLYEKRIKTAV